MTRCVEWLSSGVAVFREVMGGLSSKSVSLIYVGPRAAHISAFTTTTTRNHIQSAPTNAWTRFDATMFDIGFP